jgi:branched-chain amino acid transport system permease protein
MWMALSIGWYFFSGLTKYISLGSAAFVGLGLFFTAEYLHYSVPLFGYSIYPVLPLPVIVILAGLINFALALAIGLVTLRLKGIYFAILTFGVSMVFEGVFSWYTTHIEHTYGIYLPAFDAQTQYYTMLTTMLAILLLTTFLRRSKFGLALKMIGENEEAAVHVGVNTNLYKILGFAISAMCMAFMGGSYAIALPYTNAVVAFNVYYSFFPAIMVLLGGAGTALGPIIGSITISLLWKFLSTAFAYYFLIVLGLILITIVLFMPNGIMGMVEKLKARLRGRKEPAKAPEMPP